jgi:hypothetical protein
MPTLVEGGSDIFPTKILVGTDGSEESLLAIPTAAKIANPYSCQSALILVATLLPHPIAGLRKMTREVPDKGEAS